MLRFSTKSLLLTVTELAMGFGALTVVAADWQMTRGWSGVGLLALFLIGCALVGAGIFGIFGRQLLGAILGISVGMALLAAMFAIVMHALPI